MFSRTGMTPRSPMHSGCLGFSSLRLSYQEPCRTTPGSTPSPLTCLALIMRYPLLQLSLGWEYFIRKRIFECYILFFIASGSVIRHLRLISWRWSLHSWPFPGWSSVGYKKAREAYMAGRCWKCFAIFSWNLYIFFLAVECWPNSIQKFYLTQSLSSGSNQVR